MELRSLIGAGLLVAAAGAGLAQTAESRLTFEVASVKPAPPPTSFDGKRMIRMGAQGGPGTSDPGRITYSFVSLRNLLTQAFGLRTYQVSGPGLLDSERFDIVATVPKGATKDDVKIMLQNLLRDRFQLTFHREKKELSVYALVAGKNGPKMKESQDQADPEATPPASARADDGGPASGAAPPPSPPDPSRIKIGKDGFPEPPPGMQRPGIFMMGMMSPNGVRMRLNGKQQTMAQLADSLSNQVDRPVVDLTGLTPRYDFTLDFAPDPGAMMGKMGPMAGGMPPPPPGVIVGGSGGGDAGPRTGAPETDAATIFAAVQQQLGLKLEARKAPVDLLVIDHVEKTPSEN
jgi:uncharacterized protein (TIGR03435 family)